MLWLIVLAAAIPNAVLGLIVVWLHILDSNRIGDLEQFWTKTQAEQMKFFQNRQDAETILEYYGVRIPKSRPLAEPMPPSLSPTMAPYVAPEPWPAAPILNGHAEWNG